MKVLLLGFHMYYNLEHYVYMNLERLGHEVKFYGYREKLGRLANPIRMAITRSKLVRNVMSIFWINKVNEEIKRTAEEFHPDLVLSIKGEVIKPETIDWIRSEIGAKTALWFPDDPRFFDGLVRHIAPAFDYVFTASEKMVDKYREIGCRNVSFLPFACEPTVHKKVNSVMWGRREYNVVFVGSYVRRRAGLIRTLEDSGIKVQVYGPYWRWFKRGRSVHDGIYGPEMVESFNLSKVVLNIHVEDDLPYKVNMRTFEVTGCGAFLLTDRPYGLEKHFKAGREVAVYNDEKDLVELAKYYLNSDGEREEMALNAQERAYKEHTYANRVRKILSAVK